MRKGRAAGVDADLEVWIAQIEQMTLDQIAAFQSRINNLYRVRPDFVYSVSREFAKSCQTSMLVLPDNVVSHPLVASIDVASLCPNAEITVFPWKEPPDLCRRCPVE